jgi:dipicolinate synthase subunit A
MKMNDIKTAVIGGDMRQGYLASELQKIGFTVSAYGVKGECPNLCDTLDAALLNADFAILPYPISPDGVYLNAICESCNIKLCELFDAIRLSGVKYVIGGNFKPATVEYIRQNGLKLYDYGTSEALKLKNALCTAEGAIEIAMREMPINIDSSECAVLGYGRIGRILARLLKALGADVTVFVRRKESLAAAQTDGTHAVYFSEMQDILPRMDMIFNTVPSTILKKDLLKSLRSDCLIIDLASSPGGVDFSAAYMLGLNVIWALSLPGKCSPKSAAMIICEAICDYLKDEGVI